MSSKLVVVPWDFSNHSKLALQYALDEFESTNVRVICILEPPSPYVPGMEWGEEAEERARANCTQQFFQAVESMNTSGLQFVTEFGDPATEIARFANEQDAAHIVISTHGRTGLPRMLMGSVALKLAGKANCPMLLLPHGWFESQQVAAQNGEGAKT